MTCKLIAGIVGLILLIAFLLPPIFQVKDVSLVIAVLIGLCMAGYEFYETLKERKG